jgi:hypothetical protein
LPNRSRATGAGFGCSTKTGAASTTGSARSFGPLCFCHSVQTNSSGSAHVPPCWKWRQRLPSPRVYFSQVMPGGRSAAGVEGSGAGLMRSLRAALSRSEAGGGIARGAEGRASRGSPSPRPRREGAARRRQPHSVQPFPRDEGNGEHDVGVRARGRAERGPRNA